MDNKSIMKDLRIMQTYICVMIVAFITPLNAAAEEYYGPRKYSIIPPSPSVSSLMQYQDIQVDYFTGIPNISYDLFTIKVGSISLPISVSYHGGGMRVSENNGEIGMCWSISSGAVIARTVYGAPDDAKSSRGDIGLNGLLNLTYAEKEFRRRLIEKEADYNPTDGSHYVENLVWEATLGDKYRKNLTDVANDIFKLSGLGMSATFAYNDLGKIVQSSSSPLQISPKSVMTSYPVEFTAKDASGIEYVFGCNEYTRYEYYYGSPELTQTLDSVNYISAWHLSSITDPSNNTIRLIYDTIPSIRWRDNSSSSHKYSLNPDFASAIQSDINSVGTIVYYPKRLRRIEWDGGRVEYIYVEANESITSNSKLKSIKIYNTIDSLPVKTFTFDYHSYLNGYSDTGISSSPQVYLLLKTIYENGKPLYRFDYNTEYGNIDIYYDSQDFAGYHNGMNNEDNLTGKDYIYNPEGADRSVNPNTATIGSLKTIYYQTGGRTVIDWESNVAGFLDNSTLPGRINDTEVTHTECDTIRMCLEEEYKKLLLSNIRINASDEVTLDIGQYFKMNPANLFGTDYYDLHDSDIEHYSEAYPFNYPHITIRRHRDSKLLQVIFLDNATIEPVNGLVLLDLDEGEYDFRLVNPMSVSGAESFLEAEFRYRDAIAGRIFVLRNILADGARPTGSDYWCGVRVKSISSYTSDTDEAPIVKSFFYGDTDPNTTSGTIQILPEFEYNYYMTFPHPTLLGVGYTDILNFSSTAFPSSPLSSIWQIQYPVVKTRLTKQDRYYPDEYLNSLEQTYYFTSSRESGNRDYKSTQFMGCQPIGARMYTSKSHRRGLLTRQTGYISENVPVTEYEYNIYENDNESTLTTDAFVICDFSHIPDANGGYGGCDYGIGKYQIIPYNKTVKREFYHEDFEDAFKDGYSTTKEYDYFYDSYTDNLDYANVKSMTTTDSEGRRIATHYTYLFSGNQYTPLVETAITECDGSIVSAGRNVYDANTRLLKATYTLGVSGCSASELISSGKATTTVQKNHINKQLYEYTYDSLGHIIQIDYAGTPLVAYIWGYNNTYPIIEGKGITHAQICAAATASGITSNDITSGSIDSKTKIAEMAQSIRSEYPDKEVLTLCYRPLIGIMDAVNAAGVSTIFNYDNTGRLSEIRDFNQFLIEKYNYKYATE